MRFLAVRYLLAEALSLFGNSIIAIVLPLLVLRTTGSATSAGLVALAATGPQVLAGLVGGIIVDRVDRRLASVAADVLSAVSVAALAVVDRAVGLNLGWFITLGAVGAFADIPGMTAREALAPRVAELCGWTLDRLAGLRGSVTALVMVVGPALAGVLMSVLPGFTVVWLTAATSAAAALVSLTLPATAGHYRRDPKLATLGGTLRHSLAGFPVLRADPVLFGVTLLGFGAASVVGSLQGLLLPVHFGGLGRPELLGTVLSSMCVGLMVGSGVYAALADHLRRRTIFNLGLLVSVVGMTLVCALPAYPLLLAGGVLAGLGVGPVNGVLAATFMGRVAEESRGRVMAAQNTLMLASGPMAFGAVTALLAMAGLRWAAAALGVVWAVTCLGSVAAPVFARLDEDGDPSGDSSGDSGGGASGDSVGDSVGGASVGEAVESC